MEPPKRGGGRPPMAKPMPVIAKKGGDEKNACPWPTRFFKIILPFTLEQNKLRLPEKFVRGYKPEPGTIATLCVPTGVTRKVTITKSDNKLYFTQGWEEFIEHNFIGYGYFMIFEYRGNHNFRVNVFDLSGSEIEYPLYPPKDLICENEGDSVREKEEQKEDTSHHLGLSKMECRNPSFTIELQEYNLRKNVLHIPSKFGKKYLKVESSSIKLQADDGKEWDSGFYYRKIRKCIESLNGHGCKNFLKDNKLVPGEVITFELLSQNHNNITLRFFRDS